ncbi:MAG: tetratricopeptide repeat protein [Candidatus Omnitrophica bacterium]|nr:tetratricopeptide repeat protein [Candidatus Omnitrophota bacterium]
MKKFMAVMLIAGLMFAGCAKKEAVSVSGNNPAAKKMLVEGTVYLKQGDIKNAVGSFAAAIKLAPEDFEGYFMLSETFVHLKQYPQAISVLATAVRQFPENGLAYYLLALAHEGAGQDLPAIVAARRSVEIFNAKGDQDGVKRSAILLAGLIQTAKQKSEDAATTNAAQDAQKALGAIPVTAQPAAGQ